MAEIVQTQHAESGQDIGARFYADIVFNAFNRVCDELDLHIRNLKERD